MSFYPRLNETPSQTAGPFIHIGCLPSQLGKKYKNFFNLGSKLLNKETKGERITVTGKVFDGEENPVKDGLIEIWQADNNGLYNSPEEKRGMADPNFSGWGRSACDSMSGSWRFKTIKPGPIILNDKHQIAPHISIWFVARGINIGLNTRMYFSEEKLLNENDQLLKYLKSKNKIDCLMAKKIDIDVYEFNIYLQGKKETIFFDI